MPPKLPRVSGEQVIKSLKRLGFDVVRQQGSHVILRKESRGCVVPLHHEIAIGTLHNVLRQSGVTVEDFIKHL